MDPTTTEEDLRTEVRELTRRNEFLRTIVRLLFTLVRFAGAPLDDTRVPEAADKAGLLGAIERA
jgi:hypothetical protein